MLWPAKSKRVSFGMLILVLLVAGCSSTDLNNPDSPLLAAALADQATTDQFNKSRVVTVYLVADLEQGFVPYYADRMVYAEPVIVSTVSRAEAETTVQGINTVIIGDSCEALNQHYEELRECNEVESISRQYGDIEATAATDSEGFASLRIGAGAYRITMQSWVTAEDQKCSWSGSEILPENVSSLALPVLVFCE